MSKAILVVDMPKTCLECPLMWKEEKNISRCFATQDQISLDSIGEECPLIEVDKAPTIDAVPVIRCKDCKYYDGYYCHNEWWGDGYGNYTPPIKQEEGFCDWAERKEE